MDKYKLVVAALVLIVQCANVISAEEGEGAISIELKIYHEQMVPAPTPEGDETGAVLEFDGELVEPTPPPPGVEIEMPAGEDNVSLSITNGTASVSSFGVEQSARLPNTGFYHNGSINPRVFFTSTEVSINDGLRDLVSFEKEATRQEIPNAAHGGHATTFTILEGTIEFLPEMMYKIDTRKAGVTLTFVEPNLYHGDVLSGSTYFDLISPIGSTEEAEGFYAEDFERSSPEVPPGPPSIGDDDVKPSARSDTLSMLANVHERLAASTVAGLVITGTLLAWVLYSLFQSKDLLKNDTRRRIMGEIRDHPGISMANISRQIGIKHQSASYHLRMLQNAGYIMIHKHGNQRLCFPNGAGVNEESRDLLAIANDSVTLRILRVVADHPNMIKKEVADEAGLTRTAGIWHLNKLIKLNLVRETKCRGVCSLQIVNEQYEKFHLLLQTPSQSELSGMSRKVNTEVQSS